MFYLFLEIISLTFLYFGGGALQNRHHLLLLSLSMLAYDYRIYIRAFSAVTSLTSLK